MRISNDDLIEISRRKLPELHLVNLPCTCKVEVEKQKAWIKSTIGGDKVYSDIPRAFLVTWFLRVGRKREKYWQLERIE